MNDSLVPSWIKEKESSNALRVARFEAEKQRELAAAIRIKHEGPDFWENLIAEFTLNTDALTKSELNLQGQTITLPSFNNSTEGNFRVSVLSPRSFPKLSQADFYYAKDQSTIRCSLLNGGVLNFRMCVCDDGIRAISGDQTTPLTARELAETIVRRMVDSIEN